MKNPRPTEYDLHLQVVEYLTIQYPRTIFRTDLGGIRLPIGLAVKVAKLQCGRAFPDLVVMEPRRGHHGLCIELKRDHAELYKKDGQMRDDVHFAEQAAMLEELKRRGYWAVFACGFEEAKRVIDWYLS